MAEWKIFRGTNVPHDDVGRLPPPPPWRDFATLAQTRGLTFQASPPEVELVNAALYLPWPCLGTGPPGAGKSTLTYAGAHALKLASVLRWSINTRSTLADGLYFYDALARLRDASLRQHQGAAAAGEDIGRYLLLGPLATA